MLSKRDLLAGGASLLAFSATPVLAQEKKKYIVQIPLTFDAGKRPHVDLFIGQDGPYNFLVDTGSYAGMIREDLAKKLKLGTNGVETGLDFAGKPSRNYIYAAKDVLMGGIFKLPSLDLVGEAKLPASTGDGVLPASMLTALTTELDFEAAMIRYYINDAPQDLTGFTRLDAISQADSDGGAEKFYANVTLDGRKLVCLVDTGATGRLFLSGAYVSGHNLWNKYADAAESGAVGANGEGVKTRIVKIPNFEFGGVHFDEVWAQLGDPGGFDTLLDQGIDGIVGCDIISQFTFAFAPHHVAWIKPNKSFSPLAGARPMVRHKADASQPVLPFLYRDDRRILLVAKAGDKPPVGCLINTGALKSAIAPAAAQASGLAAVDGGFDGNALAFPGDWHASHLVLAAKPALAGRPLAVDLGLDFLTAQACGIDFDVNELTLFPNGAPDLTGYSLFAERKSGSDSRFYVTAKLAGVDTICLVDTNAQATVTLLPHAVKARNLWDAFPDAEHHKLANGGETRLVKMTGLDVAGLHRDMVPVLLPDPAMTDPNPPYEAALGMGFLHRCNFIFTPDGKLYAKPNGFWTAA